MKPLYMWAGGKSKMIPKYIESPGIPYIGYDTFVEPFFGGGAMMIHIAQRNPRVKKFVLNDINTEIVGLYLAIKNDVNNFITECNILCEQYLPLNKEKRKEFYYKTRQSYVDDFGSWSNTKEAAVLYFLMKTCFNGIWQITKTSNGRFFTPCGLLNHTKQVYEKDNVLEWHAFLQNVDIYSGDWKDCVSKIEGRALYFMDPPYRDSFTQYGQDFPDTKHVDLIDFCKKADSEGHLVMYCNRDMEDSFYTDNQGQLGLSYYDVTYTAGRRATEEDEEKKEIKTAKKAKEILLYSQ